ncbi:alpha-amylase [Anaerolentibacter hominis]|uniref:alpha-amylase n=1 Tax=Anaerolentibacter hominis TaxID=3079009 RepID=UPI0031B87413
MDKNGTIMQFFEWYLPEDASFWRLAGGRAGELAETGITAVWLPPAYKGAGGIRDVGYAVYDLYDLGEFDQKGSVPTKYGNRDEYLAAIQTFQKNGINVYADIVLNHHIGADGMETIKAEEVDSQNHLMTTSPSEEIEAWTKFDFPGREGKYSGFRWNWTHFDGVDWDQESMKSRIYRFTGKKWEDSVDTEHGNYDYLMGADVDFSNPEVVQELTAWGKWYLDTTGIDGFRLDAVKHITSYFYRDWLPEMRRHSGKELFAVGEYWHQDRNVLERYLGLVNGDMSLFDVPLHFNLFQASCQGEGYDLRRILDGTLVKENPVKAVTFVDNHDTQPGQALTSFVQPWFKQAAYALLLTRQEGYPCVFYGDYYGIPHDDILPVEGLSSLIAVRRDCAYGAQHDYLDDAHLIGWTRGGRALWLLPGWPLWYPTEDPVRRICMWGNGLPDFGLKIYLTAENVC